MIQVEPSIAWPLGISISFAILIFGTALVVQHRPGRAFHLSTWVVILAVYWAVMVVGISDPASGYATSAVAGWGLGVGGCSLGAIVLIARIRKATWPRSIVFSVGVACVASALALLKVRRCLVTYVIAGVAASLGAWLMLRQAMREHEALRVLAKQLIDAKEWKEATDDPEVGDHVSTVGLWNGTRIWLDASISGVRARCTTTRWPRGLDVLPERSASKATGDDTFDRLFSVKGEEGARRSVLTSMVRSQLTELAKIAKITVRNQTVELVTTDPDLAMDAVDRCVQLIASLPEVSDDQLRRVFDATRDETHTNVRAGGYRWLIAQAWHPQEVYEAARADADAAIAAWGREHLPYSAGAFR